jgi:hypothetical protein
MDGNVEPVREVLGELFGLLEVLEARTLAVMEFLKDAGIATDEELGPYLEKAGNASSVKWRAARLRMEFLLTSAQKNKEEEKKEAEKREKEQAQAAKEADKEKKAEGKPQSKMNMEGGAANSDAGERNAGDAARSDAEKGEKSEGPGKSDSGPEKEQQPQSKAAKQQ